MSTHTIKDLRKQNLDIETLQTARSQTHLRLQEEKHFFKDGFLLNVQFHGASLVNPHEMVYLVTVLLYQKL
jgi:hypothetical protein